MTTIRPETTIVNPLTGLIRVEIMITTDADMDTNEAGDEGQDIMEAADTVEATKDLDRTNTIEKTKKTSFQIILNIYRQKMTPCPPGHYLPVILS